MADLEFSHHVSQIPAGPDPMPYKGTGVKTEISHIPDFQGTFNKFAEDTNWMSAIGSEVATRSSNAIATKLGSELGKNPQGELPIPFTEFDKNFQASYNAQAASTLSLQAQKLITKSNLELAAQPRLDSTTIEKAQNSVNIGLQKIYSMAPESIRPQLEHQYGSVQLTQLQQLTDRMLTEQKQDRKANTDYATKVNAENAYSLAKNGNYEAALIAVKSTQQINEADVKSGISHKSLSKTNIDTVRQSALIGRTVHDYEKARGEKKEDQYLKNLSEKKPSDISDGDYFPVINGLFQHINHQNQLKNYNDSLEMTKFDVDLAKGVPITGSRLEELKEILSPINYQKTLLSYYKNLAKDKKQNEERALLNGGYDKPEIWTRTSQDAKNAYYDDKVRHLVENNVNQDEAEASVATEAIGPIKRFTDLIDSKLSNIDAAQVDSGLAQVEYLYNHQRGGNLSGVDERALSRGALYEVYKKQMPAQDAAKLSYDKIYNIKKEEYDILAEQWKNFKTNVIGTNPISYYSKIADINTSELTDPLAFETQSDLLYRGYFFSTRGSKEATEKRYLRDIKANYGDTYANGYKQTAYLPIENILGLPTNSQNIKLGEGVPYLLKPYAKEMQFIFNKVESTFKPYSSVGIIQDDIIDNISKQLAPTKENFNKNQSQDYWEIQPRPSLEWAKTNRNNLEYTSKGIDSIEQYSNGSPIVIHHVYKNGTRDTYELMVKANPYLTQLNNGSEYTGAWDVVLVSGKGGYQNLGLLMSNENQNIFYRPDVTKLRERYTKGYANERR